MKTGSIKRSVSKADKQKFIREFLQAVSDDGLPEHDSPSKLYFNNKLVASAEPNLQTPKKSEDESN